MKNVFEVFSANFYELTNSSHKITNHISQNIARNRFESVLDVIFQLDNILWIILVYPVLQI